MEWTTINGQKSWVFFYSSAGDEELMLVVGKRCRDADILASLQTTFTVNQIVHSIDHQLYQLHLKDTHP